MNRPTALKPGSRLGVCAPSARFGSDALDKGSLVLKQMGFELSIPKKIFKDKRYLAGEDKVRADVINHFFSDPSIDGIVCARGGFGAMRTLEHLDWKRIKKNPKPFVGFSDITAILLPIIDQTGAAVIHGPSVVSLATAPQMTIDSLANTLYGRVDTIEIVKGQAIIPGTCSGMLKGGNMATITHLLGTRFQPDFKDAVVFFEDIGEPAYKIDRMLTQMKMAGLFAGIQGVVTGSFENCSNDDYIPDILFETFEPYHVPVLSGLACGHGKQNLSLCMGTQVEMDTQRSKIFWNRPA